MVLQFMSQQGPPARALGCLLRNALPCTAGQSFQQKCPSWNFPTGNCTSSPARLQELPWVALEVTPHHPPRVLLAPLQQPEKEHSPWSCTDARARKPRREELWPPGSRESVPKTPWGPHRVTSGGMSRPGCPPFPKIPLNGTGTLHQPPTNVPDGHQTSRHGQTPAGNSPALLPPFPCGELPCWKHLDAFDGNAWGGFSCGTQGNQFRNHPGHPFQLWGHPGDTSERGVGSKPVLRWSCPIPSREGMCFSRGCCWVLMDPGGF